VVIHSAFIPSSSEIVLVFGASGTNIVVEIVKIESHVIETDAVDFAKVTGLFLVFFVVGIGLLFEKSSGEVVFRGGY